MLSYRFMYQLLAAISYLSERRIVHRDLKPQNVLIDPVSEVLKVTDFGLARTITSGSSSDTPGMVTLWYRAPEIMLSTPFVYTPSVDLWSAGAILAEMASGLPIFQNNSDVTDIGMLMKIFRVIGTPTEETWPGFEQLAHSSPRFPNFRRSPVLVEELEHEPHLLDLLDVRPWPDHFVRCVRSRENSAANIGKAVTAIDHHRYY